MPAKNAPLAGGSRRPVTAELFPESRVIAGTTPIWATRKATDEWEAYHFRRLVDLGKYPIKSATLIINCDDAARVYINQKPVNPGHKSGELRTWNGRMKRFNDLTACLYSEVNTYDVTSYFYSNVTNAVLVEMANQPFYDNHAYLSVKIVIEFGPLPEKNAVTTKPKPNTNAPNPNPVPAEQPKPSAPEKAVEKEMPEPSDNRVFDGENPVSCGNLHVGTALELGHVYFKPDDYALDDASYRTLSALASYLKKNKKLTIEVGGHTNLKADDKFAMRLSQQRAKAVADVLVSQGVDADRVTYKGYGKTQPKMSGTTSDANQKNQRVEVKITGM
jgi:outer membrane protein OmpA-like peptidoglycan-associated protein